MPPDYYFEFNEFGLTWGRIACKCKTGCHRVAYLNWSIEQRSIEIDDFLIINEADRQKGLGSAMIGLFLDLAVEKGMHEAWGVTQIDDYAVHDFYKKHHFVFDSKPRNGAIRFSRRIK